MGGMQSWELSAFDQLMQLRSVVAPFVKLEPLEQSDPRLLIVGVSEEDIQAQQRSIMSDQVLAQALSQLQQYQPKVIGLDLYPGCSPTAWPSGIARTTPSRQCHCHY